VLPGTSEPPVLPVLQETAGELFPVFETTWPLLQGQNSVDLLFTSNTSGEHVKKNIGKVTNKGAVLPFPSEWLNDPTTPLTYSAPIARFPSEVSHVLYGLFSEVPELRERGLGAVAHAVQKLRRHAAYSLWGVGAQTDWEPSQEARDAGLDYRCAAVDLEGLETSDGLSRAFLSVCDTRTYTQIAMVVLRVYQCICTGLDDEAMLQAVRNRMTALTRAVTRVNFNQSLETRRSTLLVPIERAAQVDPFVAAAVSISSEFTVFRNPVAQANCGKLFLLILLRNNGGLENTKKRVYDTLMLLPGMVRAVGANLIYNGAGGPSTSPSMSDFYAAQPEIGEAKSRLLAVLLAMWEKELSKGVSASKKVVYSLICETVLSEEIIKHIENRIIAKDMEALEDSGDDDDME